MHGMSGFAICLPESPLLAVHISTHHARQEQDLDSLLVSVMDRLENMVCYLTFERSHACDNP